MRRLKIGSTRAAADNDMPPPRGILPRRPEIDRDVQGERVDPVTGEVQVSDPVSEWPEVAKPGGDT